MNLENICHQVIKLAEQTGKYIKAEREKFSLSKIEIKGLNNFVTHVDKGSELRLVEGLKKILPEAGFITEEGTAHKNDSKYTWVIDPLDGTTNFIHNLPPYSISIGLMEDKEVILGVVLEINSGECFYAWKGNKAFLNGSEIKVSDAAKIGDSLVATGFPYTDYSRSKNYFETLDYFFQNSHGVRRLGSAAVDMAYVACGRFEAFYEYGLNPWDVAAGAIIIKQAGGIITDFNGEENYIFGKELIACNSNSFNDFFRVINKIMSV